VKNDVESQATTDLRTAFLQIPGSVRVSRAMPVRLGLSASRRNNLSRKARDHETEALPGSPRKFLAANV